MNARLRIRCCATPPADAEAERLQYGGHGRFRGDVSQTALETTDQMLRHVEIGCFHRTAYPITWRDAVRGTMIVADDVCERHNDLLMRLERDLPIWDDSFEWRGPTPGIPLQMLGMAWEDSEYPDDLERFSVGSLVLAYLAGNHLSRDIRVFLEESQFPHELPDLPESKRFDFALFRRRCGRLQRLLPHRPDTWRYLPDAFSVVTMSTGNQLLDYDVGDRSQFDDWC